MQCKMPKQRTTVEFLYAIKGVSARTCLCPFLYDSRKMPKSSKIYEGSQPLEIQISYE